MLHSIVHTSPLGPRPDVCVAASAADMARRSFMDVRAAAPAAAADDERLGTAPVVAVAVAVMAVLLRAPTDRTGLGGGIPGTFRLALAPALGCDGGGGAGMDAGAPSSTAWRSMARVDNTPPADMTDAHPSSSVLRSPPPAVSPPLPP